MQPVQQTFFTVHASPSSFLQAALPHLLRNQRKFNVILPHAQKLLAHERSSRPLAPGQFWIIGWSQPPPSPLTPTTNPSPALDLVLSCTEHHLGTYPLFLVLSSDIPTLSDAWIDSQMNKLARKLREIVSTARVFSIFGQEKPTLALCRHWSTITGARIVLEPYYEASSSYCTQKTFVKKDSRLPQGHEMRLARQSDLHSIAQLCQEFAADSPPFTLTTTRALQEAQYVITHGLVSVYTIDGQITTIVAVTRKSEAVAGMTKVYTTPTFRGRGCAEKLVAHVCEQQLASGVESVVLFVGHTLSAARVYHRVGFVGVGPGKGPNYIPDAERWIELGFEDTETGHW